MPKNASDIVHVYCGPSHQVPWDEICLRIGAQHGPNAILELVITSKLVPESIRTARRDRPWLTANGQTPHPADDTAFRPLRPATIADVARIAGVCIGTASRVANNKPGVRQETRMRVAEVISLLGYKPNETARSLLRTRGCAQDRERSCSDTIERPTIIDVARAAGVCVTTVSRVINNKASIGQQTRMRVVEVMNQLGYEPNEAARKMGRNKGGAQGSGERLESSSASFLGYPNMHFGRQVPANELLGQPILPEIEKVGGD